MSDATERPEDTVRRFAQKIEELLAWQSKYREAAELWEALDVSDGQMVASAVLIGKLMKMEGTDEERAPTVSIAATDDVDWMNQLGIIDAAYDFVHTDPWVSRD